MDGQPPQVVMCGGVAAGVAATVLAAGTATRGGSQAATREEQQGMGE